MNAQAIFGGDETKVNGHILKVDAQGAKYENVNSQAVFFSRDFPAAANPGQFAHIDVTRAHAIAFLAMNAVKIKDAMADLTENQCAELAYIRLLAAKYGLISPLYTAADHHCDYNQAVYALGANGVDRLQSAQIVAADDVGFPQNRQVAVQAALAATLTNVNMEKYNRSFYNMICLIAFMFRTRGHHFVTGTDMLSRYNAVWNKCASKDVVFLNTWEHISTVGLHAIMPSILDKFWTYSHENALCDVVFSIRYSAAAAGTAAIAVLAQGLRDLKVVFPNITKTMEDELDYVEQMETHLAGNRWDYSINARFYNADTSRIDESKTGAVGALLVACLDSLAPAADLVKSKALGRVARFAPITGAAMGIAVKNFVKSDKFLAIASGEV